MTIQQIDVAIIGAGTAGLSARAEVAKVTDSYRVFDPGPLGTTCARTGCMPSKAFLQSAHDYHRREAFAALGLEGMQEVKAIGSAVLAQTRALRDDLGMASKTAWKAGVKRIWCGRGPCLWKTGRCAQVIWCSTPRQQ
jgi:dihydrolipoamide dehydrogenase